MIMCTSTKGEENFQSKGKRGTSMTVLWYPHLSEEDFVSTVTLAFSKESIYSLVISEMALAFSVDFMAL